MDCFNCARLDPVDEFEEEPPHYLLPWVQEDGKLIAVCAEHDRALRDLYDTTEGFPFRPGTSWAGEMRAASAASEPVEGWHTYVEDPEA